MKHLLCLILALCLFALGFCVSGLLMAATPNIDLADYPEIQNTGVRTPEEQIVNARVEEALRTMREGSDSFKLWQISRYIADRIEYDADQETALGGLNGHGECEVYSELFCAMASRLGIEVYLCYGYAGDGYHAWNMVVLDGQQYYYDVTWFDGAVRNYKYLHSTDQWGRTSVLNDQWEGSKLKEE